MRPLLGIAASLLMLFSLTPLAKAQNQADAYYPPTEMEAAREALREGAGGQRLFFFQTDRLEYQTRRDDEEIALWDVNAWYGGRINRVWVKSEAEYELEAGAFEEAELQVLFSRAITPYFDFQAGIRQDFEPDPMRTHAVLGIQGLAPYWFEVDGAVFLSDEGELTGQLETEYELLLTQRLILQPRAEISWSAEDIPELEIGSGLNNAEIGLRLRYELRREFAPYLGVEWSRNFGKTADYVTAAGGRTEDTALVAGLRIWF